MSEFKVISDNKSFRKRERWTRLTLWGAAFALSCITLFAFYGANSASPELTTVLAWLAGLIVAASIVGANLVSYRQGMERVKLDSSFELTDKDLIRRKAGWPDVRIGLPEIRALYERQGWLVVECRTDQENSNPGGGGRVCCASRRAGKAQFYSHYTTPLSLSIHASGSLTHLLGGSARVEEFYSERAGSGRCTYDSRMGILARSATDERQTEEVFGMDDSWY